MVLPNLGTHHSWKRGEEKEGSPKYVLAGWRTPCVGNRLELVGDMKAAGGPEDRSYRTPGEDSY